MSMKSSFVYGYGFKFDCETRRFVNFLSNHKESFCVADKEKEVFSSFESLLEKEDFEDIQELFETYSGRESVGPVVAFIMSQETGIRFDYCSADAECDTPEAILFAVTYPWLLNDREKLVTEEELRDICRKYMNELDITENPEFLEQEYYG